MSKTSKFKATRTLSESYSFFSWNSIDDEAADKYDHILDNDKHFGEDYDRNRTISRITGQDFETELPSILMNNVHLL